MENTDETNKAATVLGMKTELYRFITVTLIVVDVCLVSVISYTSPNHLAAFILYISFPLIAIIFMKTMERINKTYPFHFFCAMSPFLLGTLCYYAGPDSPGWLTALPLITITLLLIDSLIAKFIYVGSYIVSLAIACYLINMKIPEIIFIAMALGIYSAVMGRILNYFHIQQLRIESQKNIIESKNTEITASIRYAKRIQQAKLPHKEEIYSCLPQSFILFKPKDIVSGDFYFFHKTEKLAFIAAADCTGHGVPGAFMSMIGSERLEDAVSQSSNTSGILKLLNKGIKTSLRQSVSDESTRDGMDIALCSVDTTNRIVYYAGANRPLWLIRSGGTTVEEIKATKKAIGGLTEDDQHFETHELKLKQGDTIYISTDGYADQFSGKDGKKLMTKKFKEILLAIQNKTMSEQEKHLDDFIEEWKAGTEQVDDVLVIGVRL